MKIAVLGWYGHDNAGDERIKYSLNYYLKNTHNINDVDFFDLHENAFKNNAAQFNNYDLVIIGGGGIILSQCNYHNFIYSLKTKVATVGVSVELPKLKGNAKKFAQALIDKSIMFLVRDEDSKNKLSVCHNSHNIKLSADLTFLEPFEIIDPVEEMVFGLNLLPKPANFRYSTLAVSYISRILDIMSRITRKSIVKVVDYTELVSSLKSKARIVPIPLYSAMQDALHRYQKNDVDFLREYFDSVPENFEHRSIDVCRIFLSMRLHGAIFAVQKAVPIISLSYLPKNRNFMKEVGLEQYVIDSLSIVDIEKMLDNIEKNYNEIRNKMITYRNYASETTRKDLTKILNMV